jgi:hypothetical protein
MMRGELCITPDRDLCCGDRCTATLDHDRRLRGNDDSIPTTLDFAALDPCDVRPYGDGG